MMQILSPSSRVCQPMKPMLVVIWDPCYKQNPEDVLQVVGATSAKGDDTAGFARSQRQCSYEDLVGTCRLPQPG